MATAENAVSKATFSRVPAYLRYLKGEAGKGVEYVSSAAIAKDMGLSAVGVRKDLIADIEKFLGYDRWTNAVIIGAGGLGRAILSYEGFENYGIHVIAAFDNAPAKIGAVGGKPVYPMERLGDVVKRSGVKVCILTVPRSAAQEACDRAVETGISAILSFAPVHLRVPDGVTVKYEDLAVSLAELCGA